MVVNHLIFHLKLNTAGVIPAIFASALLLLPVTISNFGFAEVRYIFKNIFNVYSGPASLYVALCIWNNFLFVFFIHQ